MASRPKSRGVRSEPAVVVTAANDRFALPLAVMGRSLIDNLSSRRELVLYVFDDGIRARNRRKILESWDLSRVEVRWLDPPRRRLRGLPVFDWFGTTIYLRLLVPELLPASLRRVIYLDGDTLVLDDVHRLWRAGLGGRPLGAVRDPVVREIGNSWVSENGHALPPTARYFNSGVLLMDLSLWREQGLGDQVLGYLGNPANEFAYPDQDALNAVFAGIWHELHPRWNVMLHPEITSLADLSPEERPRHAEAITRTGILHFAGAPKPWQRRCGHRRLFLFYFYLDRTKWAGWRPD